MVGKTSILYRYKEGKFIKVDEKDRTLNAACYKKVIQAENNTFELNIWVSNILKYIIKSIYIQDTAGEERYHALAPVFYRGIDGAVIVFDVTKRETFNRAENWIKEIGQFAKPAPKIILVGNKTDLKNREITFEEAKQKAEQNKMLYLDVSAFTGVHIDELFQNLTIDIYYHKQKMKHKSSISSKKSGLKLEGDNGSEDMKNISKNNDDDSACCS